MSISHSRGKRGAQHRNGTPGRNPVSLRVSLTESCQLRCLYCRPAHAELPLPVATVPWADWLRRLSAVATAMPVDLIRFTGGEPLLYPDLVPLVAACSRAIDSNLALTTNGVRLAPLAEKLSSAGLSRINISLDSLDPETFHRMTGAIIGRVLDGIEAALAAGLEVKLNTVVMRDVNDRDVVELLRFAARHRVAIRFLELMPIGPVARDFARHYVPGKEVYARLAESVSLSPLPYVQGKTSRDYQVRFPDGAQCICGLIMPTSTPFCEGCRRLRLTADGSLVGCLAQVDSLALEPAVSAAEAGDPAPMRDLLERALALKLRQQDFESQRQMSRIGG